MKTKKYEKALKSRPNGRKRMLFEKNEELQRLYLHAIKALAFTLEARDKYTKNHSQRVASYAVRISFSLGMPSRMRKDLIIAGLLHDIGKIGVSDKVLLKEDKLTDDEYEHVKTHPLVAEHILSPIRELKRVIKIIKHHHERFDGAGYPYGLSGEKIPLGSRILAVCDTYDAIISKRPFRKALSHEKALEEIEKNAGKQFDPEIVAVFLKILNKKEG